MQFSKQEQQAVLAYATALRQAGTLVSPARGAYEKARAAVERQRSASGSAQLAVADISVTSPACRKTGRSYAAGWPMTAPN